MALVWFAGTISAPARLATTAAAASVMGLALQVVCAHLDPDVVVGRRIVGVRAHANVWAPLVIGLLATNNVSSHMVGCILDARWADLQAHILINLVNLSHRDVYMWIRQHMSSPSHSCRHRSHHLAAKRSTLVHHPR